MTSDQFVWWLSGFLSGIAYDCHEKPLIELLTEMMKRVATRDGVFVAIATGGN